MQVHLYLLLIFIQVQSWIFRKKISNDGRKMVQINGNRLFEGASEIVNISPGSYVQIIFRSLGINNDWEMTTDYLQKDQFLQLMNLVQDNINFRKLKIKVYTFYVQPQIMIDPFKFYSQMITFNKKSFRFNVIQKRLYIRVDPSQKRNRVMLRKMKFDQTRKIFTQNTIPQRKYQFPQQINQDIGYEPIQRRIQPIQDFNQDIGNEPIQRRIQPIQNQDIGNDNQQLIQNDLLYYNNNMPDDQIDYRQDQNPYNQRNQNLRMKKKTNIYDKILESLENDDDKYMDLLKQLDLDN